MSIMTCLLFFAASFVRRLVLDHRALPLMLQLDHRVLPLLQLDHRALPKLTRPSLLPCLYSVSLIVHDVASLLLFFFVLPMRCSEHGRAP